MTPDRTCTPTRVHKLPLHASVPTVREMLLVDSETVEAQLLRRSADGTWPKAPTVLTGASAVVELASIGMTLSLATAYEDTWLG